MALFGDVTRTNVTGPLMKLVAIDQSLSTWSQELAFENANAQEEPRTATMLISTTAMDSSNAQREKLIRFVDVDGDQYWHYFFDLGIWIGSFHANLILKIYGETLFALRKNAPTICGSALQRRNAIGQHLSNVALGQSRQPPLVPEMSAAALLGSPSATRQTSCLAITSTCVSMARNTGTNVHQVMLFMIIRKGNLSWLEFACFISISFLNDFLIINYEV